MGLKQLDEYPEELNIS